MPVGISLYRARGGADGVSGLWGALADIGRRWRAADWVAVLALAWLIRSTTLNGVPFQAPPLWMTWFDQSRYFASATAFAHGNLSAEAHWYPLAYPLLAAPIAWLSSTNPFMPLDLVLYVVTGGAVRRVAARLGIGTWPAVLCFVLTTLIDASVARGWVDPWTTTLSAALIWTLADRALQIIDASPGGVPPGQAAVFGTVAAAIPLVRPVDAIVSLACVAVVLIAVIRQRRLTAGLAWAVIASGAAVVASYALLHLAIYGARPTPYMVAAARTGFIWSDIGWKAYVLLIHARPWFPDTQALFERMPWILVGGAGLIVAAIDGTAAERRAIGLLLLMTLPVGGVMLTYADLQPPGLWRFGNIHYFKWSLPLFGLGVVLALRQAWAPGRPRWRVVAMTLACLLPMGLRVVPQPVSAATPARMLTFAGDTGRAWDEAYFAPVVLDDAGGAMANINDFHQVPDATGQRMIAVSRLFRGAARRNDPGEAMYRQPQAPDGRFAGRWTFVGR
ncbi:hypothetical protein JW805_00460 [Roseomonas aeriglobus]|nr:hypothetical protein [Roseomonas aeriglobus]